VAFLLAATLIVVALATAARKRSWRAAWKWVAFAAFVACLGHMLEAAKRLFPLE
jgi:hypothetical protein